VEVVRSGGYLDRDNKHSKKSTGMALEHLQASFYPFHPELWAKAVMKHVR
jgi:hypothetical protein